MGHQRIESGMNIAHTDDCINGKDVIINVLLSISWYLHRCFTGILAITNSFPVQVDSSTVHLWMTYRMYIQVHPGIYSHLLVHFPTHQHHHCLATILSCVSVCLWRHCVIEGHSMRFTYKLAWLRVLWWDLPPVTREVNIPRNITEKGENWMAGIQTELPYEDALSGSPL